MRKTKSILTSKTGNVGVLLSLAALPLFGLAAGAVDFANARRFESDMQNAADAAVLAGARETGEAREARAHEIFDRNLVALGDIDITARAFTEIEKGARYEARASMPTLIMGLFGTPVLPIAVSSEANLAQAHSAEFVIAFDTTSSMVFTPSEMDAAIERTKDFIDHMFEDAAPGAVIGSVMPFSDRVRLPESLVLSNWTTGAKPPGWRGCLDPREENVGGNPFKLTDAPVIGVGNRKFTFFEPVTRVHTGPGYSYHYTTDCHGVEITPARDDPDDLKDALDSMSISGTGRMDEAMSWAWRLLSPRWSGQWGRTGYPSAIGAKSKFIIFVSDGRTAIYDVEVVDGVTSYGANMGSRRGYENLEAVCADAKAGGIVIYALQLNGNPHATPHFQRCASSDGHFMIDSVANFEDALNSISVSSGKLRLTK
jgi:hypothetical protein